MTKSKNTFNPIYIALILVAGMWIGRQFQFTERQETPLFGANYGKIEQLIFQLENNYVDNINVDSIVEGSIQHILDQLDPHSTYISSKDMLQVTESMQGNFDGIGIEYQIQNDTIRVVTPISGGPSEKLGIKSGDCILKVDTIQVAGIGITNKDVVENLRGERGSMVKVLIKRPGITDPIAFDIIRDKIPIHSVDVSMMLDDQIGYIKINRFAATTYDEYLLAFKKLKDQGMQKMVLDLRNNPGGYLHTAIDLIDEFLGAKELIVYTEGAKRGREYHYATKKGDFEKSEIVVLINEGSASASEIVAGAIQDNDRGIIIGRRSFGKGLVQEQSQLGDGSALRITTSRYYTPSGRCIQKSYEDGLDNYHVESLNRFASGELFNADSVVFADSLIFKTTNGRSVYGGGGIYPDHFIPLDTTFTSRWLNQILSSSILNDMAYEYSNSHRDYWMNEGNLEEFAGTFDVSSELFDEIIQRAEKETINSSSENIQKSNPYLKYRLKSLIARKIWGNEGLYKIWNTRDNEVQKAIEILHNTK